MSRWLAKKGRLEKAHSVLAHIRSCTKEQVKEEFEEIVTSTQNGSKEGLVQSIRLLLKWRVLHR